MKPGDLIVTPTRERGRITEMGPKHGRGEHAYQPVTVEVDGELRCYLRNELIPVLVPRPRTVLGMIGRM